MPLEFSDLSITGGGADSVSGVSSHTIQPPALALLNQSLPVPMQASTTETNSGPSSRAAIFAYLNREFREHVTTLVSSLNTYMAQMITGLFNELRGEITNRPLYVLFEASLGCDPMTDHLAPKNVLPLFEPFIDQAEKAFRRLTLHKFKHDIESEFCAVVIAELQARLKAEDVMVSISSDLERLRKYCEQLLNENSRLMKTAQAEREKLTQQINSLTEQLTQKKRVGTVYRPDGMPESEWTSDVTIPELKKSSRTGAKEIVELELRVSQEAEARARIQTELETLKAKYETMLAELGKIPELQAIIDALKEQISSLQQMNGEKDSTIFKLNEMIEDLISQLKELRQSNSDLERESDNARASLSQLQAQLQTQAATSQVVPDNMSKQLADKDREIADLLRRLAAAENERDIQRARADKAGGSQGEATTDTPVYDDGRKQGHSDRNEVQGSQSPGKAQDEADDLRIKKFVFDLTGFNLLTDRDGFGETFVKDALQAADLGTPISLESTRAPSAGQRRTPSTRRGSTPKGLKNVVGSGAPAGSASAVLAASRISVLDGTVTKMISLPEEGTSERRVSFSKTTPTSTAPPSTVYYCPPGKNDYNKVVTSFYQANKIDIGGLLDNLGLSSDQLADLRLILGQFLSGDPTMQQLLQMIAEGGDKRDMLSKVMRVAQNPEGNDELANLIQKHVPKSVGKKDSPGQQGSKGGSRKKYKETDSDYEGTWSGQDIGSDGRPHPWKQVQTGISMKEMDRMLSLYASYVAGYDGIIDRPPSRPQGIQPDFLSNKEVSDYISERLKNEHDRTREEVLANQTLEKIERLQKDITIAVNVKDAWCQTRNVDNSSGLTCEESGGDNDETTRMGRVEQVIKRSDIPVFKVKYDRAPRDWTVKGVFARLYNNAAEIRAKQNRLRAECQQRDALAYAKYLRAQNRYMADGSLLRRASEFEEEADKYGAEVRTWDAELSRFAPVTSEEGRDQPSRTKQVEDEQHLPLDIDLTTATYESLIRITSVAPPSPDFAEVLSRTAPSKSSTPLNRTAERTTTIVTVEAMPPRGTTNDSSTSRTGRSNSVPKVPSIQVQHTLKQVDAAGGVSVEQLVEKQGSQGLQRHGSKPVIFGYARLQPVESPRLSLGDKDTHPPTEKQPVLDLTIKGDMRPEDLNTTSREPKESGTRKATPRVLPPLVGGSVGSEVPSHITHKVVYDANGRLVLEQELYEAIVYKDLLSNPESLQIKERGARLIVIVPGTSQSVEIPKDLLRRMKENLDRLVEFIQKPGISNFYGNDIIGRVQNRERIQPSSDAPDVSLGVSGSISASNRTPRHKSNFVPDPEMSDFIEPAGMSSGNINTNRALFEKKIELGLADSTGQIRVGEETTGQALRPLSSSYKNIPTTEWRAKINHLDDQGEISCTDPSFGLSIVHVDENPDRPPEDVPVRIPRPLQSKRDNTLTDTERISKRLTEVMESADNRVLKSDEGDASYPVLQGGEGLPVFNLQQMQQLVDAVPSCSFEVEEVTGSRTPRSSIVRYGPLQGQQGTSALVPPRSQSRSPRAYKHPHPTDTQETLQLSGTDLQFTEVTSPTHSSSTSPVIVPQSPGRGDPLTQEELMVRSFEQQAAAILADSGLGQPLTGSGYGHHKLPLYNPQDSRFIINSLHIKKGSEVPITTPAAPRTEKGYKILKQDQADLSGSHHDSTSAAFLPNNYLPGKPAPYEPFIQKPTINVEQGLLASASERALRASGKNESAELLRSVLGESGTTSGYVESSTEGSQLLEQPRLFLTRLSKDLKDIRDADSTAFLSQTRRKG
ncbi:Coiled-coil protein [Giardia muris]|uniref:Coiled-coil protein n=1 Tax=Giardia muris TaxID=5742 RepID=A0A4Z1T8W3_GIAMU|nr:Coiled-coil protein [Giardia muris]|eukprot:TNJ30573.1 Coiled-coil protein [Giardia muris]